MDSLLSAAARALAAGDPLGALKRVALRDDPPALALRGISMAQLGEYTLARQLLRRAARGFGPRERLARARCLAAEAEVALAERDLVGSERALETAARALSLLGDHDNALHARLISIRRMLLLGRSAQAESALDALDLSAAPAPLLTIAELARAEIALRALRTERGRQALERAGAAARRARIPALLAEVKRAGELLSAPAARSVHGDQARPLTLGEVEKLIDSGKLIVDGCRYLVRVGERRVSLARRPVLFALARALAEAWPSDVDRDELVRRAFEARLVNETHRVRLRVELSRLRSALRDLARVRATERGFVIEPIAASAVVMLAPPVDGQDAALLALLQGGEAWSTSALALALGCSQRTAQRSLVALEREGRVRSIGRARSKRWLAASVGSFATTLLLPSLPPTG